jgi:hypothetical protein
MVGAPGFLMFYEKARKALRPYGLFVGFVFRQVITE